MVILARHAFQPTTFHLVPSHLLGGRGVSVEGEAVAGAAGDTGQLAGERRALDVRAKSGGGLGALEPKEVGAEPGNVGRGHRGARDGVLGSVSGLSSPKMGRTKGDSQWRRCCQSRS